MADGSADRGTATHTLAGGGHEAGAGSSRVVVMGVTGSGKTTVGRRLAAALGLPYADGDDFHSAAAVAKMSAGVPLDDADREPWLGAIAAWLRARPAGGVVSCSALHRRYRDTLRTAVPDLFFVHLVIAQEAAEARLSRRRGHFMPSSLVASQFADLEPLAPDERGLAVDAALPVDEIAARAAAHLDA